MHDGEELLGPLGMPFLHPWANRLSDPLDGADVPRDERGLPIHGTHPASWTVEAHDRVPPRPVGRQRGLRPQALGRELDAPVGEAGARDAPHEAILLGDAVGVEQPVQPGLLGAVGLVDRGRDADGEAELAQQRDSRARPVEAARSAVGVVQPRRAGVQRHLEHDAVAVERLQRPPPASPREQHRVGEDRHGQERGARLDELAEVRVEERLAAGQQQLAAAEAGELLGRSARHVDLQAPGRGARRRFRAAVVAGQVAVEVRVQPEPRAERRGLRASARGPWAGLRVEGSFRRAYAPPSAPRTPSGPLSPPCYTAVAPP